MGKTVETALEIRPFDVDISEDDLADLHGGSRRHAGRTRRSSPMSRRVCSS